MHLDEEQVQRTLHGELGAGEASVRAHLEGCSECRTRLLNAKQEEEWVVDRFRQLDHRLPRMALPTTLSARRRPLPTWGRLAAGIFLVLAAAGVAYAVPGSPLPLMIQRVLSWVSRPAQRPVEPAAPSGQTAQPGIAVAPGSGLTIVFQGDQSEDTAVVGLTDGGDVMVRARGGTTSFTSDPEGLSITHEGAPATYELLLPRTAPLVELRAGHRRIFLKKGPQIVSEAPRDWQGRYRVPLSQSGP